MLTGESQKTPLNRDNTRGSQGQGSPKPAAAAVDKAKTTAVSQLAGQKGKAADAVGTVASSLRQAGKGMEGGGQGQVAQYVSRAADQLDQLSGHLKEKDVQELVGEVEGFARRQPALFLGATFAAGVLAARFLKSSSDGQSLIDRGSQLARSTGDMLSQSAGGNTAEAPNQPAGTPPRGASSESS